MLPIPWSRIRECLTTAPVTGARRFAMALILLFWVGPVAVSAQQGGQGRERSPEAGTSGALTTVAQIHELTPEAAARHLPIHLRGVVTAVSSWPNAFFFQDATGGVSIENPHPTAAFDGAEVEIVGQTAPGLFAPVVQASSVRVRGPGKEPKARLFSYFELAGGSLDSQWIAVRGIVRSAKVTTLWEKQVLTMMVEVDGNLITVQSLHYEQTDFARLVDAAVYLRGVCTTSFNDKRQFVGIGLHPPSMAYLKVEKPSARDPFSLPVVPVRNLLQFHPGVHTGHRVQVTGTVTYYDEGHTLYVQDGDDGVLVETEQNTPVPLGTRIAVVGFPASSAYSPVLRDAIFRSLGGMERTQPAVIRATDFLRQSKFIIAPYDAQLVHLQGQLLETTGRINGMTWLLKDGDKHFEAILDHVPGGEMPSIGNGSTVSVTGIFSVKVDESHQPAAFQVLLRSPSDLVVVERSSWWTSRHALGVVGAMLIAILAVTLWSILLRSTVRQQTQMLRESEERFRNQAQHDSLTGLRSRSYLQEELEQAIHDTQRRGDTLGVLMVDLDHFKQVNDTLGHHAGDELLRLVAARIRSSVRKEDLVARMGGDEFVVLLKDIRDASEAARIGAQVVAVVSEPTVLCGHAILVSASVGVCLYPEGGRNCDALLQNVDAAMYRAKASGRNSFSVYSERKEDPLEAMHQLTQAGS